MSNISHYTNYGYKSPEYASTSVHHTTEAYPHVSAESMLSASFPDLDRSTISAILTSTNGAIDPAFYALTAISRSRSELQPRTYSHQDPPPYPSANATGDPYNTFQLPPLTQGPNFLQQHLCAQPSQSEHTHHPTSLHHPAVAHVPPRDHLSPYPSSSPELKPISRSSDQQATRSMFSDLSKLSLHHSQPKDLSKAVHFASCDGCKIDPMIGRRWKCVACADYDLCDDCRKAGIHAEHRFEELVPGIEIHPNIECDGCNIDGRSIWGTRYVCLKHDNEDFCARCVNSARACSGPFKEIKQTDLGRQLEVGRCLPMPQEWSKHLQPAIATYNVECSAGTRNWLERPSCLSWFDSSKRQRLRSPVKEVYKIETKRTKGKVVSDDKDSWVMENAGGSKLYSYSMEMDRKTKAPKREKFEYHSKSTSPSFTHGPSIDALAFENPKTGLSYRWVTNRPISTLNDERFDFQRYALFQKRGHKEVLVADMTWWDGSFPNAEDSLSIRDANIDHAMVIASLTIVHDHQWKIMAEQLTWDKNGFSATEEKARLTVYGKLAYWNAGDFPVEGGKTSQPAPKMSKLAMANAFIQGFSDGFQQQANYNAIMYGNN